jgi:ornithine cyclodeaminase/alanine dehydrogenase-like protein (mu-crystallin family)
MVLMVRITEADVERLLPMRACIDQMRLAFEAIREGKTLNQPRRRLILPTGSVLHQMAGAWGEYFGTKIYSSNLRHGGLHEMYVLLYDAETGKPLAFLEALNLSLIRTGAASGYAAELLARPDAEVIAIIGSGAQARTQVRAIRAARPIREVRVWSRNPDNVQKFAEELDCVPCGSAEQAVRGADIVVTATTAKDAVIAADWIAPGTFIAAMGSNIANRRELPGNLVKEAGLIAVDDMEQARIEAGDLLLAYGGTQHWKNVEELQNVAPGYDPERITIFESLGIAVEDVAAAAYVYEKYTMVN